MLLSRTKSMRGKGYRGPGGKGLERFYSGQGDGLGWLRDLHWWTQGSPPGWTTEVRARLWPVGNVTPSGYGNLCGTPQARWGATRKAHTVHMPLLVPQIC